jgi:cytidine diphosphoramidate kinase
MRQRTCGTVWWITGLSGSGKTIVSGLVRERLLDAGHPAFLLDGDTMRGILDQTGAHTLDDRRRLAFIYSRFAREIASQGIDVVCATISMFHEVRQWNREHMPNYREIYLRVPFAELESRDPRGIYRRGRPQANPNVVGLDLPFEEPSAPDLVIDNYRGVTPAEAASRILSLCQ